MSPLTLSVAKRETTAGTTKTRDLRGRRGAVRERVRRARGRTGDVRETMRAARGTMWAVPRRCESLARGCGVRKEAGAVGEVTRRVCATVTLRREWKAVVRGRTRRACKGAAAEGEGMGALRRKRTEASASMPPARG